MPFSGLSLPAYRIRVFPSGLLGLGWVAKHGSAKGYTTLIVAMSTSRKPAQSEAA